MNHGLQEVPSLYRKQFDRYLCVDLEVCLLGMRAGFQVWMNCSFTLVKKKRKMPYSLPVCVSHSCVFSLWFQILRESPEGFAAACAWRLWEIFVRVHWKEWPCIKWTLKTLPSRVLMQLKQTQTRRHLAYSDTSALEHQNSILLMESLSKLYCNKKADKPL